MKWKIAAAVLFLVVVSLAIFKEVMVGRLRHEVLEIQSNTMRAFLEFQATLPHDLNEQDRLFVRLREDLQRCRTIETTLRRISPREDFSHLEKGTTAVLETIEKRQQDCDRVRELAAQRNEAVAIDWNKVPPWEPGQAGPPGTGKPAPRSESNPEGGGKLQPEMEESPR